MFATFIAFFSSLILSLLIIRYQHLHARLTGDSDFSGPQKMHTQIVPRVGGLAIWIAIVLAFVGLYAIASPNKFLLCTLLLCSFPGFLSGLAEDLTKSVGVKVRLIATAISALLASYFLQILILRLDLPWIDWIFSYPIVSFAFTAFAVAGVANAYNIIDGFNGLASMVAIITLLAIGYIGFKVQDTFVSSMAIIMIGAIAGFFVWNYPRGLIFLGDGGAYFIGLWVALLSVALVARNNQVSAWFALLINAYPITETVFTMWRRKIHQGKNPGLPDAAHFHSLIYRRIVKWANIGEDTEGQTSKNARTSPYLWVLSCLSIFPAILVWDQTIILIGLSALFFLSYIWLYRQIVKFKTPKLMK